MSVTRRNKKCIFLSCLQRTVRKKDITTNPVRNVFLINENTIFCLVLMMLWNRLHFLGEEDYNLDKRDMF